MNRFDLNELMPEGNWHVEQVTVVNGDDNSKYTDAIDFIAKDEKLFQSPNRDLVGKHSGLRIRNEVGILITIAEECNETNKVVFQIAHHKGNVYIGRLK